jgi:hypothetical protein
MKAFEFLRYPYFSEFFYAGINNGIPNIREDYRSFLTFIIHKRVSILREWIVCVYKYKR